ncbi:MAG: HAD-IC family P-type ATPase [Syntrophobacteraceae bacterium]
MIRLLHAAVPGRARYRLDGLSRSPGLRAHLERRLAENPAIIQVSASTWSGSVLVFYNSGNSPQTIGSLIESVAREYSANGSGTRGEPTMAAPERPRDAKHSQPVQKPGDLPRVFAKPNKMPSRADEQATRPWHLMEADAVLAAFDSCGEAGLSDEAVIRQRGKYGLNSLPECASRSRFGILVDQFKSLPVALLGVAAGISVVTGGVADAVVILSVVAINGVIGYVTESESEKTINSLKNLARPSAAVLRESTVKIIAAEELVPGDILVLRPGTSVAADGRLLDAHYLSVDESVLTGESLPVVKTPLPISGENIAIADRVNMVYMGTMVTGGRGLAVVVATGRFTEVGCLQTLVGEATSPDTPMERQLNRLGDQLVLISGAACGIVFLIGLLRGYGFIQMFRTSISLAVAAVPEGLPAVATTTLALGIRNMRKHRVLIRQLEAVETLGSVQTICFDKTGTITLNKMSVLRVFAGGKPIDVHDGRFFLSRECIDPQSCDELLRLVRAAVLCNETEVCLENGRYVLNGSPTENALIHLGIHASVDLIGLKEQYPLLKTNYRSENRMFMGTLHGNGDGRAFIALKGSPPEVLAMCDTQMRDGKEIPLTDEDIRLIELENERMAGDALRVLGVACSEGGREEDFGADNGFVWLGLIGMADPVRPGARDLIGEFHKAGIDTVMLTGDQSPTAYAIGKEVALSRGGQLKIMDSTHLADIEPDVLRAVAAETHVFARVSPAHKLQIVQALQAGGRVVAMTGDGINDGPALKAADIGIAMGAGGTDMAREVADVILEDDNLETMIIAVRDGRTIYNNIRKALRFLLATNFSEIMVMFLTVAAGVGSPFNPMQLLWINLISDIFPGLALAMEEPEPNVLHRPPRPPDEPIVGASDFKRLTFEAATISAGSLGAYAYGVMRYGMGAQAGAVAFQSLTLTQLLHAISCRSETHSIFSKEKPPPNKYLTIALGGSFALQMTTMLVPGLMRLLGLTPIGIIDGLVIGGSAVLPLLVNEATKTPAAESMEKVGGQEQWEPVGEACPAVHDVLPQPFRIRLANAEGMSEAFSPYPNA